MDDSNIRFHHLFFEENLKMVILSDTLHQEIYENVIQISNAWEDYKYSDTGNLIPAHIVNSPRRIGQT